MWNVQNGVEGQTYKKDMIQDQEDEKDDPFTDLPNTFVVSSNHLGQYSLVTVRFIIHLITAYWIRVRNYEMGWT